jgi:hypothetical protein
MSDDAEPSYSRLSDLLEPLGSVVLDVVVAPSGLAVPVGEPLIYDPAGGELATADDLLLGVGVDAASPEALDLLEHARQVGASGVILKIEGDPPSALRRAAEHSGVALLAVPTMTAWGHLLTLLKAARGARPRSAPEDGGSTVQTGDLFGLADAIATMVGGATTIEDLESNVLAYSNVGHPVDKPRQATILGRRVPEGWAQALVEKGVFRELYRTDRVVRIDELTHPDPTEPSRLDLAPRLAIAVRAGGEALGSIWVQQGTEPLTAVAEEALRSAAQIAAIHLLRHRAGSDIERRRRHDRLQLLLEGDMPSGLTGLRLPLRGDMAVLAIAPELADHEDPDVVLERLVWLVTLQVEVFRRHTYAAGLDGVAYVLLSSPEVADRPQLLEAADRLRRWTARSAGRELRLGIGSTVSHPRHVARSRAEADQVLEVLADRGESVGHVDDLRGAIALLGLERLMRSDETMLAGRVEQLLDHDRRKGTNYAETLRAYLDFFGDVVKAADSVNIHRNTFRYRLARLVEISGLELDDPEERLIAHLQLRLTRSRR